MAKYGDIVALLEYMDKKKPQKGLFKKPKKEPEVDLLTLLEKKKREAQVIETFIEEQAKLRKKEEKKEEKKGWDALSPIQQAAYLTFAIQAMSLLWLSLFLKMVK